MSGALRLWLVALFSWPALASAQDRPLSLGDFEAFWGLSLARSDEIFDAGGARLGLEDTAGLTEGSYRELMLEARLRYAIRRRLVLSLEAPVVRAAQLEGQVIDRGEPLGTRVEEAVGPGDLRLGLALQMEGIAPFSWGFSAAAVLPVGAAEARLPRGTGRFGLWGGVWLRHETARSFLRAGFEVGSENGPYLELAPQLRLGLRRGPASLAGALDARLPLQRESAEVPEVREALTGVADGRAELRLGPELRLRFGSTGLLLALKVPVLGQSQAAGAELSAGVLLGPPGRSSD